jgi:rhamnose transport system permease protein
VLKVDSLAQYAINGLLLLAAIVLDRLLALRQAARLRKKSRERSVETTPKLAKVTP